MSVFVGHNHLLHNLFYVLIGGFHYAIHLWSIWIIVVVLDLELHAEFPDHSVVDIYAVVYDNPFGDAIPTYEVMLDEPSHTILGGGGK